jgi:DNA-directed RNA polymerase III subunit RPC8
VRATDKVVPKIGLVICVYDILDIQGGFVYPSDGAAIYDVKFRLVVFLPFIGEVLVGRLASSSK